MSTNARRFTVGGPVLFDRATGLEWARMPADPAVPWADAAAAATARGMRLPTAAELMTLLDGLSHPFSGAPDPGDVVWSSSGSPFAPAGRVRAIACEDAGRFAVVLRERTERARWWGVAERRAEM